MQKWSREVKYTDALSIQVFCVEDKEWQKFRESLKGIPTAAKLQELISWGDQHSWNRRAEVQVDNYINALKRGGQLNDQCEVVK